MKFLKTFFLVTCVCMISFSSVSAQEEPDYRSFVDIVYEWSPYGNVIQIGDFTISNIQSVWLDNGGKEEVKVSTSYIKQGGIARAVLIDQDENGFWNAYKIIVFSGKGLEKAIQELPLVKRKTFLSSH